MKSKKLQRIICIALALLFIISIVAVAIPIATASAATGTGKLIPCIEENVAPDGTNLQLIPSNGYAYGNVIQINKDDAYQNATRGAAWYSNYTDVNGDPLEPIMMATSSSETKSINMNIGVAPWYFASEDNPELSGYWLTGTAGVTGPHT